MRYVQKCTQQQKWQKWQNFANNNLEANANEKTRVPLGKLANLENSANLVKMVNWSKSPTIWRPMQMRRQEGPLVKPANFANLAKVVNWSKSPITWRSMQMRRQECPLGKPANLANLANLAKMTNWSKPPTFGEDKRAPS